MFIELLHDQRIPLLRKYPKELGTGVQIKTCPQNFVAALFTIVKR